MSIVTRYITSQAFRGLFLAFSIIVSLIVIVDFVELSRRFGSYEGAGTMTLVKLTLFKLPGLVEQTLPFIILFGIMWSMFRLNRRSELVAMRAAGYSAWRFATPPTILALLIGIAGTTMLNPGAAFLSQKYDAEVVAISRGAGNAEQLSGQNIWLREAVDDGTLLIRAGAANAQRAELINVTFIYYDLDIDGIPRFGKRIDAPEARLVPGFWELNSAIEHPVKGLPERKDSIRLSSSLHPNSLLERLAKPSSFSFWALPRLIQDTKAAKLEARRYELQWQRLLSMPLTLAAMALIGAAFSFKLARLGGAFRMAVTGGSIGFLLYFAGDLLEALGASRVLPAVLAIWAPPAFVFVAGLARITIVEDG